MLKKLFFLVLIIILNLAILSNAFAQTTCANGEDPPCDEQATFISVAPDALILLDLSGSMDYNPAGGNNKYGNSLSCVADTTHCGSNTDPQENGFRSSSTSGCNVDCSRLAIAKRALFNIMDDDNNNKIDSADSDSLGVRLGFMRFRDGNDTSGNYASGNIKLIRGIGSTYQQIYCLASATGSCASTLTSCVASGECIVGETDNGGTPLASALKEAKLYLDYHKGLDSAKDCRQKFVILLTDGSDTYACNGSGSECDDHSYDRRRATVAAAKALNDAGYKVFVIGFGSTMPAYLQNTLNWMAYYGGTDNPLVPNTGSTPPAYDPANVNLAVSCPASGSPPNETTGTSVCNSSTNGTCECPSNTHGGYTADNTWYAASNDPGHTALSGYAFLAGDADTLVEALKSAMETIREATYTFSEASVQAVRTQEENFLYEATFQPLNADSFWIGHLSRYQIDLVTGDIASTADWDAGSILSLRSASDRTIYTFKSTALTPFTTVNIVPGDVGVTTTTDRDMIVNFIRGGEIDSTYPYFGWKLGDIFHSFPVNIGAPSLYFFDTVDQSSLGCSNPVNASQTCKAFDLYRDAHPRDNEKIIIIGANDGQLHAFKTGAVGSGGSEAWSFLPPNFLPKLKSIAHSTHPTALSHQYFVDGYMSYAEVWLGTGSGTSKSPNDWHTVMVFGEGRGGNANLWSQSSSCDSLFNNYYVTTATPPVYYPNYCGYYAFDLTTSPLSPQFKWRIGSHTALTAIQAGHLGQPWSKMIMGRVQKDGNEKWVGFIAGGYSGTNCAGGGTCDTRGKGFYVIDLGTGDVISSYTHDGNDASMDYDLVANPASVDIDDDGFVDAAYVGDLGGNVWRFKFCKQVAGKCTLPAGVGDWTGGKLFNAGTTGRRIFHMDAAAKDDRGNLWIYYGTGDNTDPTNVPTDGTQEKYFAIMDNDRTSTYTIGNLKDITNGTFNPLTDSATYKGWYIRLTAPGEKVLAESTVFAGTIYFTTYVPASDSNPCNHGGSARLYAINYLTGAGVFTGSTPRYENIGEGVPSAPIVSVGPTGSVNIYASTSEGGRTKQLTKPTGNTPACPVQPCPPLPENGGPKGLLFWWHDLRVQ